VCLSLGLTRAGIALVIWTSFVLGSGVFLQIELVDEFLANVAVAQASLAQFDGTRVRAAAARRTLPVLLRNATGLPLRYATLPACEPSAVPPSGGGGAAAAGGGDLGSGAAASASGTCAAPAGATSDSATASRTVLGIGASRALRFPLEQGAGVGGRREYGQDRRTPRTVRAAVAVDDDAAARWLRLPAVRLDDLEAREHVK